MKTLTTAVAVVCATLTPVAAPLAASAAPLDPAGPAGLAAPALQVPKDQDAEFRAKFRQALELGAKEEITKLVRTYNNQATSLLVELCQLLPSGGGSDRVEKELAALREGWKTAYKSAFGEKMYNYFSLLDPRVVKELDKLNAEYDKAWFKYDGNLTKKEPGVFEHAAGQFEGIAKAYSELGYHLYAARSFNLAGICNDTPLRGPEADLNRAADDYGEAVKSCQAFDINDGWYAQVKARFDSLTREGKGAAAGVQPGAAPPAEAKPEPVKAAATTATMRFEAVPSFETFLRPNYFLDDVAILWPVVYMREKGTGGEFSALESKKVKLLRTAAAALAADLDGDGKADQPVPSTGNHALVQIPIGEGAEKRDWAFVTEVGTDKENYQGLSVNFQPTDGQFVLYVMSAASMVGTVANVPVRVFDDNMDGQYGTFAKQWQYPGLPEGALQSDVDAIVVGAEKRARPWSQYTEIAGTWYELVPEKGGLELKASPTTIETGKLKLEYKGELPEFVILQGQEAYEKTFVDLLQNGGAEVNAPAGKYTLYFGVLRKGKKQQVTKALILPGKRTKSWVVEPGKTTTVAMGAPFGFDFETVIKDGKLTVKGKTVTVIGSAEERYERLWNCVPRPELAWRKEGTKKASKPERLGVVEDINAEDENGKPLHGYEDTYHPLDLSVEVKLKENETAEAQLVEKKNKLFGAIESVWRK